MTSTLVEILYCNKIAVYITALLIQVFIEFKFENRALLTKSKTTIMKKLAITLSAFGLIVLSSCAQQSSVKSMLENPAKRQEVIQTIVQNSEYKKEFMGVAMGNNGAMPMMKGKENRMDSMMNGDQMKMMMKDSTMMHSMMDGMMKDPKMMGTMMSKMHDKGMMSKDCMKSCKTMMEGKGMDMKGMKKMNSSTSPVMDDHKDHH